MKKRWRKKRGTSKCQNQIQGERGNNENKQTMETNKDKNKAEIK